MPKINPIRQKAFKVFAVQKGQLRSFISTVSDTTARMLAITYKPKCLIKPKVGKIFTFCDLLSAKDFAGARFGYSQPYEIWEVEIYGAEQGYRAVFVDDLPTNLDILKSWWENPSILNYGSAPSSTLYCHSLRLVKKVC